MAYLQSQGLRDLAPILLPILITLWPREPYKWPSGLPPSVVTCLSTPTEGSAQMGRGSPGSPVLCPFPPFLGGGLDTVTGTVKGE